MKPLAVAWCAIGLLALVGCSSSPKALVPLKDNFSTERFSNGIQVFVYTVDFPPAHLSPLESRDGAAQPRSRKSAEALVRIDERLLQRLKQEGYCANGFIELERFIGADHGRIRGECR